MIRLPEADHHLSGGDNSAGAEASCREPWAAGAAAAWGLEHIGIPDVFKLITSKSASPSTVALLDTGIELNLALVWVALRWASVIVRVIGEAGSRAVAKVFQLLLAAIGVTELALQETQRYLSGTGG
jgi:hypothetical protein